MRSALQITALPGNKIEVQLPPGSEGQEVTVFVVLPIAEKQQMNILEFIEQARQQHAGKSVEEIDRQIQAERDSWDS